jgi:NAD(P)-dependent dehydrogenase (short-subunit alcohol dehydrogenase family)
VRVLVTGAARGLGAALVAAFRARGEDVLATDREGRGFRGSGPGGPRTSTTGHVGGARDAATGHGVVWQLDVTSDDDWAAARDHVEDTWGGLDVLVNNAGIAGGGRLDVATLDEWRRLTEVNLFGAVRGTQAFVPLLKAQRSGHVVNIASLAGLVHPAGMAAYNAVKAAVVALTETTGHELAGYGIRATAVCPSYFRTGLADDLPGEDPAVGAVVAQLVANAPLGPEEIAAAVLEGIDRGDELVLPDPAAQAAFRLKLTDRAAYDAQLRQQAARLEEL